MLTLSYKSLVITKYINISLTKEMHLISKYRFDQNVLRIFENTSWLMNINYSILWILMDKRSSKKDLCNNIHYKYKYLRKLTKNNLITTVIKNLNRWLSWHKICKKQKEILKKFTIYSWIILSINLLHYVFHTKVCILFSQ